MPATMPFCILARSRRNSKGPSRKSRAGNVPFIEWVSGAMKSMARTNSSAKFSEYLFCYIDELWTNERDYVRRLVVGEPLSGQIF